MRRQEGAEMASEIRTVGVIGAGQMGSGIAHVCAVAGYRVLINDVSPERIAGAIRGVEGNLARQVTGGKLTDADRKAALARIAPAAGYGDLATADLVIEAAIEDQEVKGQILASVSKAMKSEAILATNTSSISITRLAATTNRPEKFIGIHFMNPVPKMELVELIRGIATSDATFDEARTFVARLGKT
jgi:3-hydroxybutyryl-CoA dehydrogenase